MLITVSQAMEDETKETSQTSRKLPRDWMDLKTIINKTKVIDFDGEDGFQKIQPVTQEIDLWIKKVEEKAMLGFYTNFNPFFYEIASDMKSFNSDLLNPKEVKEACQIMQINFINAWDKKLYLEKKSFQNYFLRSEFAQDYAKAKISYYTSRDEEKAKKWQEKINKFSFVERSYAYYSPDQIMGIEFLHNIEGGKLKGKGSTIAVVEIEGSPSHTAGVLSTLKTIPHSLGDRMGIVPEASVKLYNLKLPDSSYIISLRVMLDEEDQILSQYFNIKKEGIVNFIINKKKENEATEFQAYFQNGTEIQFPYIPVDEKTNLTLFEYLLAVKKGTILDCIFNGETDDEVANVFKDIIKNKIKIINFSNSVCVGPNTLSMLKEFVDQGGLVIKAVANLGISWNKEGLYIKNLSPNAISGLKFLGDLTLYSALLKEEFKTIRQGFLMVGNLSENLAGIHRLSDKPGDSFNNHYIGAWGTDVPVRQNESDMQSVLQTGASVAAPMVTGVVTILNEIYPKFSPLELGKLVRLTGYKGFKDYDKDLIGEGRLDAKAAFEKLKE